MNKKTLMLAIVIVSVLAVGIISGFYLENQTHPLPKTVTSQYLTFSEGGTSKIFLESATSRYEYWTKNDTHMDWFTSGPIIHTGDPVFIVNATIRNDYTQNDPKQVNSDNLSIIIFYVKLYDQKNNTINALQAYPKVDSNYFKSNQWDFESGKSGSFELYFSTPNRNIDHYEISVAMVSSVHPP